MPISTHAWPHHGVGYLCAASGGVVGAHLVIDADVWNRDRERLHGCGVEAVVDVDHRDAGVERLLQRRQQRFGIDRSDDDRIDLLGYEILDDRNLLLNGGLVGGGRRQKLDADLVGFGVGALEHDVEVRVFSLTNVGDVGLSAASATDMPRLMAASATRADLQTCILLFLPLS